MSMLSRWFGDRAFIKHLNSIAIPVTLQSFMLAAVAAADSLMLGSLDASYMSAVSQATQIQFIQNMLISSIVSGATILGAQYWGKGAKQTVRDIFCMSLRLCSLISLAFFLCCELCPGALMTVFTNVPELKVIGIDYLRIAGWSYLITGISQCYLGVMKISEHADVSARISITAVVVNIVLNAFFIYGIAFFPRLNAKGAALATVIARVIELLLCFAYSFKKDYIRPSLNTINTYLNDLKWTPTETIMVGIGQSITQVTPIAVARYVSAIANNGTVYDAQIIDKVIDAQGNVVLEKQPVIANQIITSQAYFDAIHEGMREVTAVENDGTAADQFKNARYKIAAKTGTAQRTDLDLENNAWLVTYAPADDPKIVVVVYIQNGYAGAYASQAAITTIEYYLDSLNYTEPVTVQTDDSLAD